MTRSADPVTVNPAPTMNVPVLTLSTLLFALPALQAEEGFTFVEVANPGNVKINTVRKNPTGNVRFKDVPFKLPPSRLGMETDGPRLEGPISVGFTTIVHLPTAIYILLTGRDVKPKFKGKPVGEVVLTFTDAKINEKTLTYPITAGETVREWWADKSETPLQDSTGNPKRVNVYTEPQTRNGKPIAAFMDMYVIELDPTQVPGDLTGIEIKDTSRETVGDTSPSLIIAGITVKHE